MNERLNLTGRCWHCRRPLAQYEVEVIDEVYLEGWVHFRFNLERGPVMQVGVLDDECQVGALKLKDARWKG